MKEGTTTPDTSSEEIDSEDEDDESAEEDEEDEEDWNTFYIFKSTLSSN